MTQKMKTTLNLFVFITISTSFIILFTYGSTYAYDYVQTHFLQGDTYPPNTSVGPISIEGLTNEEAYDLLNQKVTEWKTASSINLVISEEDEMKLDEKTYEFNINETLNYVVEGSRNSFKVDVNETYLNETIQGVSRENNRINKEDIKKDILRIAGMLAANAQLDMNEYIVEIEETENVSESIVTNYAYDGHLNKWIRTLDSSNILPEETFSILAALKAQNVEPIPSESLNAVATAIYKAVLNTNFEIVQRHINRILPSYASLGYEAKVGPNDMDLVFYNPNLTKYKILISEQDDVIFVKIKGEPFDHKYVISLKDKQRFEPKKIVHYSSTIEPESIIVKNEGRPGFLVFVYRNVLDNENNIIGTEFISEDFYPPKHRVEVRHK